MPKAIASLLFFWFFLIAAVIALTACRSSYSDKAVDLCKEFKDTREKLYCMNVYFTCRARLMDEECYKYLIRVKSEMVGAL